MASNSRATSAELTCCGQLLRRLRSGAAPVVAAGTATDPSMYADPIPQALVLTAIVISFATTALLLVVLLASRGLNDTDHVDGREPEA